LLGRVVERARAAGAATLILNVNRRNVQAIRAYERYGLAIREAVVVDIGNGFVMDD
jgi:ribosomal protein S18 acetylase RimI-like enzyme